MVLKIKHHLPESSCVMSYYLKSNIQTKGDEITARYKSAENTGEGLQPVVTLKKETKDNGLVKYFLRAIP